ncbi:MAG: amidase [Sulfurifustaceae bacterium]
MSMPMESEPSGNPKSIPLWSHSAVELVARLRAGRTTAAAVLEAHIRRIQEVNPQLNAMIVPLFEQARVAAREADAMRARGDVLGPLHGVPITIKESFDIAETPSTAGLASRATLYAKTDNALVERLKRAGAIVLGKTNVPQLLLYNEADNPLYGRTNNPWSDGRAPGGSSGGEAALIAAGASVLGIGSDIGGSIREPAHSCGIHGLKPTSGRLSVNGSADEWLLAGQEAVLAQPGPLARYVGDLAVVMQVLIGDVPAAPTIAPVPWRDPNAVEIDRLRIGMYTDDGYFPAAPALRRAVREASAALREAGAEVIHFTPPDVARAMHLFFAFLSADRATGAKRLLAGNPIDKRIRGLMQTVRMPAPVRGVTSALLASLGQKRLVAILRSARGLTTRGYWDAIAERTEYQSRFYAALDADRLDAIICPPHALPALTHGGSYFLSSAASYAMLYNLLGMPAGVVAATRVRAGEESDRAKSRDIVERAARRVESGSAGLPVGVQVIARHWREDVVLAVMQALEEHFSKQPDYPRLVSA